MPRRRLPVLAILAAAATTGDLAAQAGPPAPTASPMLTAACLDSLPARAFHRVTLRLALDRWGFLDSTARGTIDRAAERAAALLRRRVAGGRDSVAAADAQLAWRDVLETPAVAWIRISAGHVSWRPATGVSPRLLALVQPAIDELVTPASALATISADELHPVHLGVELAGAFFSDSAGPPPIDPARPPRGIPVFTLPLPWQSRLSVLELGPEPDYPPLALRNESRATLRFDVVIDTAGTPVPGDIALVADEVTGGFPAVHAAEERARTLAAFVKAARRAIVPRRFTPPAIAGCVTARRLTQGIRYVLPE